LEEEAVGLGILDHPAPQGLGLHAPTERHLNLPLLVGSNLDHLCYSFWKTGRQTADCGSLYLPEPRAIPLVSIRKACVAGDASSSRLAAEAESKTVSRDP
jgi:hypothetical protein